MKKNLNVIDIKVIKFLLSAGVYSELAIVKNFGITYEELADIYNRLEQNGYLENYSDYAAREGQKSCSCTNSCSSCNSRCNKQCGSCGQTDYSNVKVLTWKAVQEFDE